MIKAVIFDCFGVLAIEGTKNQLLLDYIRDLKKRGQKIGLLSNIASNWIRDTFLTEAEQSLFDDMVLSFEVGMTKPDPAIFDLACTRLEERPAEVVLVDDLERYCKAAESFGMKAIHYQDFSETKSDLEAVLSPV